MSLYEAFKDAVRTWVAVNDREHAEETRSLRAEVARLEEENGRLREEARILQEKLSTCETLRFEHNVYWDSDGGPYCPTCYTKTSKAIPMQTYRQGGVREYHCPACHAVVDDPRDERQGTSKPSWLYPDA